MEQRQTTATAELVKMARKLERLLARRRALNAKLAVLEQEILTARRFINDLARPFTVESGDLQGDGTHG